MIPVKSQSHRQGNQQKVKLHARTLVLKRAERITAQAQLDYLLEQEKEAEYTLQQACDDWAGCANQEQAQSLYDEAINDICNLGVK